MRPELHVKAFTAVEITYFAKKSGVSLAEALERLKRAGLDSLPGGGAEIFDPEVRKRIAGGKAPAHTWLEVHEAAHRLGLLSNATMLYGHVEEYRHRVDHMLRLRDLQDRTGGFKAFIPLRYRNDANALSHIPEVPARGGPAQLRRGPPVPGQYPASQGLLGDAGPGAGGRRPSTTAWTIWTAPWTTPRASIPWPGAWPIPP